MSIVPIGNQDGTIANPFSLNSWDPEDFFTSINRWDPFQNLPFPFPTSHSLPFIFKTNPDVLVYIDDDNMLQISTEDGNFMSKFKLPDNARRDQLNADMVNGVLTVTIPKEEVARHRPNVRVVEIEGSG
ncbi:hypothetical protein OIU77_029965 [Salix suchowensis]|uniref:SHSP domain-containing protein n=1 Tax=Salix suchowensis TaxID=1278906 RepID=A0ABQ9BC19_9ROSI|nr:hypothetical protein OIU77_029965 [Salix suchowensis]